MNSRISQYHGLSQQPGSGQWSAAPQPGLVRKSILSSPRPAPPWLHQTRQDRRVSRQLASLSIADMSPKLAVQRVVGLFQRGEHREAAAFLRRVSPATFKQIVHQGPSIDIADLVFCFSNEQLSI